MPATRDPVSVQFDAAAARLLRRADTRRGQWAGTYVRNPSPEWMLWGARNGVRLLGPDTQPGGLARTRWCRALTRSVYYLHKHYYYEGKGLDLGDRRVSPNGARSLQFQAGTVRLAPGGVVVGRAYRIRFLAGGEAALAAVGQLPDSQRIYDDAGNPAGRWADPALRDW
jgi:hypothetical protein